MGPGTINAIVWLVAIVAVILVFSGRRRRRHVGAAASGAVYDMLNEDKRNAVEIIVEERAGARDPEDRDGNLPDLEDPNGSDRRR
ncbi:MAG: hypothetical protein ACJ731_07765 [Vicinamibacterales bacterium]